MAVGESHPDPAETYLNYSVGIKAGLDSGRQVLGQGLELTRDLDALNEALGLQRGADLIIRHRVAMHRIDHPEQVVDHGGNFAPKFRFIARWEHTGLLDWEDKPEREPIPASKPEILNMRNIPILRSLEEIKIAQATGQFPGLHITNHSTKPAFVRMLNLFPGFTTDLVHDISLPTSKGSYERFEAKLFVAYQLMARMVDIDDPHVRRDDGSGNPGYLRA